MKIGCATLLALATTRYAAAGSNIGPYKSCRVWQKKSPYQRFRRYGLADIPAGSQLYKAALSFNQQYAGFLKLLTDAFNGQPQLLLEAVPKMFEFRNLMGELIRNPLPGSGGLNAMPTFEVDIAVEHEPATNEEVDA